MEIFGPGAQLLSAGFVGREFPVATFANDGTTLLEPETDPRIVRKVRMIATISGSGAATFVGLAFSQRMRSADEVQYRALPSVETAIYVPGRAYLAVGTDGTGASIAIYVERWLTPHVVQQG